MARPEKHTVDYFPHYCVSGKTMFILETRFADKGYAFWFKTLEMLGTSEGHAYHFANLQDRSYLEARTRTTTEQATEILNVLADLVAIDKELWLSDKIIWSDNFVAGIKDAYRNRTADIPEKPIPTPIPDVRNPTTTLVSDVRNAHSRVNKSKVKETKEEKTKVNTPNGVVDLKNQHNHPKIDFDKLLSFFNSNRGILPEVKKCQMSEKKEFSF